MMMMNNDYIQKQINKYKVYRTTLYTACREKLGRNHQVGSWERFRAQSCRRHCRVWSLTTPLSGNSQVSGSELSLFPTSLLPPTQNQACSLSLLAGVKARGLMGQATFLLHPREHPQYLELSNELELFCTTLHTGLKLAVSGFALSEMPNGKILGRL